MGFWETVGGAVGGAVGSVAGPLGSYVGSKAGESVGDWFGGLFGDDEQQQPIEALELYRKIRAGNSSSLHGAGDGMQQEARAQNQLADDAHQLTGILESAWTGDASDGAREKIRSYAKAADTVAQALSTNSGNFTTQASGFDRLQSTMQPLADPPPERDFWDRLAPWDTDAEDAINANNRKAEQNLRLFESYDRQSTSNADSLRLDYGQLDGLGGDIDENEAKSKREEEERRRRELEERRRREEELRRRGGGGGDEQRRLQEEAERRRRQAEAEAEARRRQYEEELRRRQAQGEEEARRRQAELDERRREYEEEARRRQAEAEQRRRQMEEELRRRRGQLPDYDPSGTRAASTAGSDFGGSGGGFGPGGAGAGFGPTGGGSGAGGGMAAFGPTGGAPGAGAGNLGAGKASGAGAGVVAGGAAAARGAAGMGRGGMGGGMMGGAGGGAGKGQGGEDKEHKRASFLQENDPNSLFGTDEKTVPPVIGE